MSVEDRNGLQTDEMLRPGTIGLRPFSAEILRLCQKLSLSLILPIAERRQITPKRKRLEEAAICYLLDAANDLTLLAVSRELDLDDLTPTLLAYELRITPRMVTAMRQELERKMDL